jgi:hypothetical protein
VILPPKQALGLAQWSIAVIYLVKAKFWGKYLLKNVWLFVNAMSTQDAPNCMCQLT